jgi:hypothetical protein
VSSPYDYAVVSFSDALLVGSDSALLRYVNLVPANDTFSVTVCGYYRSLLLSCARVGG